MAAVSFPTKAELIKARRKAKAHGKEFAPFVRELIRNAPDSAQPKV